MRVLQKAANFTCLMEDSDSLCFLTKILILFLYKRFDQQRVDRYCLILYKSQEHEFTATCRNISWQASQAVSGPRCIIIRNAPQLGSFLRQGPCFDVGSGRVNKQSTSLTRKGLKLRTIGHLTKHSDRTSYHHRRPDPLHCVGKKYAASSSTLEGLQPLHTLARGSHPTPKGLALTHCFRQRKKKFPNMMLHPRRPALNVSRTFLSIEMIDHEREKSFVRDRSFFLRSIIRCKANW